MEVGTADELQHAGHVTIFPFFPGFEAWELSDDPLLT